MKTGLGVRELAERIRSDREDARDFLVPSRAMRVAVMPEVQGDDVSPGVRFGFDGADGRRVELAPNGVFHDQVSTSLGIPRRYYGRMMEEAPDLLARSVNTWLERDDRVRMVRSRGPVARALLSNRYRRLDHDEVAEAALPALEEAGIRIESAQVTDRRLYIQAIAHQVQGEVRVGDVVRAGVLITNSEVGFGALRIEQLVWRLVCSNGAVMPDGSFRKYHVGASQGDVFDVLSDDARQATNRATLLQVRDVVRAAVDPDAFRERLSALQESASVKIDGADKVVEVLAKRESLSDGERSSVLDHLIRGGDLSLWGLANAVTDAANDRESYDRAVELERLGGALMADPAGAVRALSLN